MEFRKSAASNTFSVFLFLYLGGELAGILWFAVTQYVIMFLITKSLQWL